LCALLAGLLNHAVTTSVISSLQPDIARDLRTTLSGLTGISFLALCIQFLYAQMIGPHNKTHWTAGFLVSAVPAIAVFCFTYFAIESSPEFQTEMAVLVAIVTFLSLFSATKLASLLINQEWKKIGGLTLAGALARLFLWQSDWFTADIKRLVLGILVTNLVVLIVLVINNERSHYKMVSTLRLRQRLVPLGIYLGILVILAFGSVARRGSLGLAGGEYSDATLTARSIFFLVAIIAYASFPGLCMHPLFSLRLARHFRQGVILALTISAISGSVILFSFFISDNFPKSPSLVFMLVIGWMFFSSALIPYLYFAAHNSRIGLLVFIPACSISLGQMVSTTSNSLALSFLVSTAMLLILGIVPAFARTKPVTVLTHSLTNLPSVKQREALTIVVPSYNPGNRVLHTIEEIRKGFLGNEIDVQVVVVSDGSTDGSVEALNQIKEPWFTHIALKENSGKGHALRAAFVGLETRYVGFIDADGDIPASLLPGMVETIRSNRADVVFGSKWHPNSVLAVSLGRKFVSKVHHFIQVALFKIDISDTQVGIKIYNNEALQIVLPTLQESTFSLDIEIFVAMAAHGYQNFIEIPVIIERSGGSTISFLNVGQSLVDLLRIFWRSRISLNYEAMAYETKATVGDGELL
jgi:hypothetical protein